MLRTTSALAPIVLLTLTAGARAAEPQVIVVVSDVHAPPVAAPAAKPSPARVAAQQLMAQRCALCHGPTGRADGTMSKTLIPRPRAFTDAGWQRSVDDAYLVRIITGGGTVVGKSPIMPANPDLEGKTDVVTELVKIVRGFTPRGIVRAHLTDAEGALVAKAEQPPGPRGERAHLTVSVPPASYTLRVFHDADEDGTLDEGERSVSRPLTVSDEGAELTLSLDEPPAPEPAPAPDGRKPNAKQAPKKKTKP